MSNENRVGYELIYDFPQSTPMIMVLGTHFTRASDVITPDYMTTSPSVPISPYRDIFGNWCSRIVAPAGRMRLSANGVVRDSGLPDVVVPSAFQHAVEDLPPETLVWRCHVAMRKARAVYALRIFKPPRRPRATWFAAARSTR